MSVAAFLLIGGNRVALHAVSLCTGLGGIERGLEIAAPEAFKPVLYVERELSVAAIIANEIEAGSLPAAPIWSDVKTLTSGSVARYLDRVGVDCITGGYPCQPFSVAGRQLGTDDPRHLWPFIAQAIERYSPALCFFENVAGHLVLGFQQVCECLERMDYRVAAGIFTASEVGASHRRERLFILAVADRISKRCKTFLANRSAGSDFSDARRNGRASVDVGQLRASSGFAATTQETNKLGDTEIVGRRSRWTEHAEWHEPTATVPSCFAPGPNADWRSIVERWPELAPAVVNAKRRHARRETNCGQSTGSDKTSCRSNEKRQKTTRQKQTTESTFCSLVDGVSRAEQLRALGNAVVPQCAAVAFLSLWAALMEDAK